jgi:signal peptidase II
MVRQAQAGPSGGSPLRLGARTLRIPHPRAANLWVGAALGLILGGAIGNAWDRFLWGAVADFFDAHAFGYHFWAFNIADVGISVGVTMLVLDSLLARGRTA